MGISKELLDSGHARRDTGERFGFGARETGHRRAGGRRKARRDTGEREEAKGEENEQTKERLMKITTKLIISLKVIVCDVFALITRVAISRKNGIGESGFLLIGGCRFESE